MTRTRLKALVVEDDANVVECIRRTMVVLDHECVCVTNVQDARAALGKDEFHYVLLDLKIPAMPDGLFPSIDLGMTFLAEVDRERGNRPMPILVMTSYTDQGFGMAVELTQMGASRCISKPLDDKPLSQIIQEVLADPSRRLLPDGVPGRPASEEHRSKPPKTVGLKARSAKRCAKATVQSSTVTIDVPAPECYGELDVAGKGRFVLRVFKGKIGPGRRAELCNSVPLEKQAYRILEAGVTEARRRYIECRFDQARDGGAPVDRSECEPDAEKTFEVEWTQDQLAVVLHKEEAFGDLAPNQKAAIRSAMRRLRNLVTFAPDGARLVSDADDTGTRRVAIPLRLRKSGQP